MNYCKDCKTRYLSNSGNCPLCKNRGVKYENDV